jgi:O-antigen/teichoic acid export membrane protein
MLRQFTTISDFTRNVLTLITGTSLAQAIPIAISPILTRLYTPAEFGIFALYMSIASLVSIVATARYELAIVVPRNEADAVNILSLSLVIAILVSIICVIIVLLFNKTIARSLGNPEIENWLYFIPLTVLLTGINQSFSLWFNRKKRYKGLAISRVSGRGISAASNVGMGYGGVGASGLIIGGLFGLFSANIFLGIRLLKEDRSKFEAVTRHIMVALARKYSSFLKFNAAQAFTDMIRENGITILIQAFFSSSILGFYFLAVRIVKNPLTIIGSSISQVFYREIAERTNSKTPLYPILKSILVKLLLISTPIFGGLYWAAPILFGFIFGESWTMSGKFVQALIPWFFMNFIISPVTTVPIVLNRQGTFLIIGVIYAAITLMSIYTLWKLNFDAITLISILSVILSLYMLLTLVWIVKISREGVINDI